MKTLLILCLMVWGLQAASIEDFAKARAYETSYAKAKAKAIKSGKPIMLVMVTHYCPWCRKYERDTLSKKSIATFVKGKYIPLILNREKRDFPSKFDTPRIPTTFFVDPKDNRIIYKEMGFKTKSEFLEMEARSRK